MARHEPSRRFRVTLLHWSIVAIMGDVTDADRAASSIQVQSNELVFGPRS